MISIFALEGIPEIAPGDDLAAIIAGAAAGALIDGDILVVTSKIVSKAEGRIVRAPDREQAITEQTVRLVASKPHAHGTGVTRIVENPQGLVLAAAGVDASNTPEGTVLLLPEDPDASARAIAAGLRERTGKRVGVIISDTLGRPWRLGQIDLAIGAAGVHVFDDLRGRTDSAGRTLEVTITATADELAAATDLVKGKTSGRPVAVVRGLPEVVTELDAPGARSIVRSSADDLFSLGTREAFEAGVAEGLRRAGVTP
ncbi:coenzyme F420-0:L-glutamate ligase [Ruicaihuangia caeni]|uniref:Coenzyme F420-0:L-glutamate ligase n=1 Tax=Ruicaihuangia caeni TaxID=3042517 RepID=A0AAW6T1H8_9MICO|nr:coenzyme F420-0:L-glutamate ligase [Klugiella sp. YN-L-19]MDI2097671.1 coenzyme F420-0:L-glutamate ligase [Klugiella sp. YN-L-19]